MSIVVMGSAFMDVKGFPLDEYIPTGRNAGRVEYVHGGVGRNVAEDIANVELRPIYRHCRRYSFGSSRASKIKKS